MIPGGFVTWSPMPDARAQQALAESLERWRPTRYGIGQQCRGVAADCVRFVCGVLDDLSGKQTPLRTLPPDTCFHDPELAHLGMQRVRQLYEPTIEIEDGTVQPGDVIVTGPRGTGPCHALIVGPQRNTAWHCCAPMGRKGGVSVIGIRAVYVLGHVVYSVFRLAEREWA